MHFSFPFVLPTCRVHPLQSSGAEIALSLNTRCSRSPSPPSYSFRFVLAHADNPLICDCELRWYSVWLGNLRDKDDEMMSKKRTVCMMASEHREYSVQNIPLERMGCVGKNAGRISSAALGCKVYVDATFPLVVFAAVMV